MSCPASDFSRLMQRAAEGDQHAFTQLFHLYNPALLAQLRCRLKKICCLRSLLEPDDLAQNIWIGFVNGILRRHQFPTPNHFLRYLARSAGNEIRKTVRDHLGAQKRDARRCQSLSETSAFVAAAVVADPSPPPEWSAEIHDQCERGISCLTEVQQQVARMIGAGFNHTDIAWKLRCSERTIERTVGEIRQILLCV